MNEREEQETLQIENVLRPAHRVDASPGFKERVMRQVEVKENARGWFPHWAWVAAAAAVLVLAIPVVQTLTRTENGAVALLADSVHAWSGVRSVHLIGRMRSPANEPFDYIQHTAEFVPLQMWKDFGNPPRWRVEKPGRLAVMNGTESTMLYGANHGARGGPQSGFVEWLKPLLDADKVLEREMVSVQAQHAAASMSSNNELRVTRKAQGDFRNMWALNKSIAEADHTCIYRFDPATKRLVGLEVVIHEAGKDTTVLVIDTIRYNEAIDPALFTVQLPENVNWAVAPEDMPTGRQPLPSTPSEVAERVFTAFAQQDWAGYLTVSQNADVPEAVKKIYGGLTVVSIGRPFQSGLYGGWFVPYEVKLTNGKIRKHNLAVRNDNPEGRWYVDGGI